VVLASVALVLGEGSHVLVRNINFTSELPVVVSGRKNVSVPFLHNDMRVESLGLGHVAWVRFGAAADAANLLSELVAESVSNVHVALESAVRLAFGVDGAFVSLLNSHREASARSGGLDCLVRELVGRDHS